MNAPARRLLPLHAKVSSALTREASYEGLLPIARLERLRAVTVDGDGSLQVELQLRRDKTRVPKLEGRVRGELPVVCQRCLRPFQWPLDIAIDLRLVFNEDEESRVLKDSEPLLIEDDQVLFHAVVEEEVLLALPYAPRCEREDCEPG
ncbi:MAG: DNA-binding protein [Xanthomonadaceae bacterium]|nr:DNA-binding protein [Xanthomonadaceae bacterium]